MKHPRVAQCSFGVYEQETGLYSAHASLPGDALFSLSEETENPLVPQQQSRTLREKLICSPGTKT